MLELYVNETKLEPVNLGAQKGNVDGAEVLVVTFKTEKQADEVLKLFRGLPDDTSVKVKNEKREQVYTGYVSIGDEISVKANADGTYNYTVYLHKKSALEIAQQAAADVEYLAAVSGAEL
mgnify:CR=1 FL=1